MNGPEHYRRAEQIVDDLESNGQHYDPEWYAARMAQAQVHATLALAMATNPSVQYVVTYHEPQVTP